jgi:hypothetical protein
MDTRVSVDVPRESAAASGVTHMFNKLGLTSRIQLTSWLASVSGA